MKVYFSIQIHFLRTWSLNSPLILNKQQSSNINLFTSNELRGQCSIRTNRYTIYLFSGD
jgi:hypothetical protein